MQVISHVQCPKKLTGGNTAGQSRIFVCMSFSSSGAFCMYHAFLEPGCLCVLLALSWDFSFLSEGQWVSSAALPDVSNTSAMKDGAVLYLPLCSLLFYWKAFKPAAKKLQTFLGMFLTPLLTAKDTHFTVPLQCVDLYNLSSLGANY